ncbi:MAG TPA: hypothetical protein VLR45_06215 [Desulfoprunum sp.]|nr:hypothetical protein [Desulfoprunum sp.]
MTPYPSVSDETVKDRKTWIAIPLFVDRICDAESTDFFVFFCLLVWGCRHQALEQGHDSPFRFLEKALGLLEGDLPGRCEPGRFLKHDIESCLVDKVLANFFSTRFLVQGLHCDSQVVAFLPEGVHLIFPTFIVGGIDFELGMQMRPQAADLFRQFAPPQKAADIDDNAEEKTKGQTLGK